jgi:alpha-glucoside transport system permease protein
MSASGSASEPSAAITSETAPDISSTSGASVFAGEALSPRERLIRFVSNGFVTAIVVLIGALWSIPTLGLFISSFRTPAAIHSTGWWTSFIPPWQFTIENYQHVLEQQGIGQAFLSSLIIAIPATVITVIIAAFAAYAFAWMKFPARDAFFLTLVGLQVVPIQLTLIPILQIYTNLGITGSYLAVWLAHTAYGLPFAIYLLCNFFRALPSDLLESARIDGAGHLRIFFNMLLPLSVPSLAALVIFQFMWVWNDLLVALIFIGGGPNAPLTVKIASLVNSYGTNYEVLTSAAFISMALPLVIFFSLQRYFVRGILAGSVKG